MHRDVALDFDSLVPRLRCLAGARGWLLAAEACVESTNDRVRALVEAGHRMPAVAVAAEQTAGVGRRGTKWESARGDGLWFSLVVPADGHLPVVHPGIALAGRLVRVLRTHHVPACAKWPNDLYLEDGKLGGLMIRRGRIDGSPSWLAGVGINWRRPAAPLPAGYRAAAIVDAADIDRPRSTDLALALIEAAVDTMRSPASWPDEVASLSRDHYGFGLPVVVERASGERETGTVGAIRADGDLDVARADGSLTRAGAHDRVRLLADRA